MLPGSLTTNFSEIWIKIRKFSFMKMYLNISSAKRTPFCLDRNVLNTKKDYGIRLSVPYTLQWRNPCLVRMCSPHTIENLPYTDSSYDRILGSCFTNVSRALQNNPAKIYNAWNYIYGKDVKPKLCVCARSHTFDARTKFQLEILIRSTISAIRKVRENFLESSRNVSETPPGSLSLCHSLLSGYNNSQWCATVDFPYIPTYD